MVKNINAQEWLDQKYPLDGVCQRDNDLENKGKKREDIANLDISQEKVGNKRQEKSLFGSLKLNRFTNLRSLKVNNHQLINLDVSDCSRLVELECNGNQIDNLSINGYNIQQAQALVEVLGISFEPEFDAPFCDWLQDNKSKPKDLANIEQLKKEYVGLSKAQKWLDKNYPKEKRKNITNLDIKKKNLEGELDLNSFTELEYLNCSGNQLTFLSLDNCPKLKEIWCHDNLLTKLDLTNYRNLERFQCCNTYLQELDLSVFQPEKLVQLSIGENNLPKQDLSVLSKFVNLEVLYIGGGWDGGGKIEKGVYNRFSGSLEALKNMKKLWYLDIMNTDIDRGLEYLPDGIRTFCYQANVRRNARCKNIEEQLSLYDGNFQTWKRDRFGKVDWDNVFIDIQKQVNYLQQNLLQKVSQESLKKLTKELEREYPELAEKLEYYKSVQVNEEKIKELKDKYIEKARHHDKNIDERLEEILKIQKRICTNDNIERSFSGHLNEQMVEVRSQLIRKAKLTPEEIKELCQLQNQTIQLKISINKQGKSISGEELNQITNIYYGNIEAKDGGSVVIGSVVDSKMVKKNINTMTKIINILLIGRTGSGKSTLGNVLINKNNNFEEVFKESAGITSETKNIQTEEFEVEGIKYRIIDTVGIGDEKLSEQAVISKLNKLSNLFEEEGLNQIFFVSSGRLDGEKVAYELLETIFTKDISKYVTIIRTRSPNKKTHENDRQAIRKLLNKIESEKIIFVDNPPIIADDSDDEGEIKAVINKRGKHRKILLEYLEKNCNETYCPNLSLSERKEEKQSVSSVTVQNAWSGATFHNNPDSHATFGSTIGEIHHHDRSSRSQSINQGVEVHGSHNQFRDATVSGSNLEISESQEQELQAQIQSPPKNN